MSNSFSKLGHYFIKKIFYTPPQVGEVCTNILKDVLQNEHPSMIARFGSNEIKAVLYPMLPFYIRPLLRKTIFNNMYTGAGFFPSNESSIRKFSNLMLEDMKLLDVLGCWRIEERFLQKRFPLAQRIQLNNLEPYLQKNPWSEVLANKKILVVHPFNKTIEYQYFNNREQLFLDKRVLPKFKSFQTIRAVQSIAGNDSDFSDWFAALDYMKSEMDKKDFDIVIIGCGAYGFPLAAHAKRMGKKAIHLGGPTQMLFGIKGKRWVENENFKDVINDYFVFPSDIDTIANASKVEDGCYW